LGQYWRDFSQVQRGWAVRAPEPGRQIQYPAGSGQIRLLYSLDNTS